MDRIQLTVPLKSGESITFNDAEAHAVDGNVQRDLETGKGLLILTDDDTGRTFYIPTSEIHYLETVPLKLLQATEL